MKYEILHTIVDTEVVTIAALLDQMNSKSQPEITKEFIEKMLLSSQTTIIVARDDSSQIVGIATMTTYQALTATKTWIEDVVVDENFRGKGIGTGLIKYVLKIASEKGIKYVNLTSNPKRVEANKLYQKLGFKIVETNYYRYTFE